MTQFYIVLNKIKLKNYKFKNSFIYDRLTNTIRDLKWRNIQVKFFSEKINNLF